MFTVEPCCQVAASVICPAARCSVLPAAHAGAWAGCSRNATAAATSLVDPVLLHDKPCNPTPRKRFPFLTVWSVTRFMTI